MSALTLNVNEFDLLRKVIEETCGIVVGDDKVYLLEARLSKLAVDNDCDNFGQLYDKLRVDTSIKNKVIDAMTTNETLWFRDKAPYECFTKYFFPQFAYQLKSQEKSQISIWSAACSSGQEPYSISIACHEYASMGLGKELTQGKLAIMATDISSSVLFLAKNARYDALSMSRGMPDDLKQKYFDVTGRVFTLKEHVKNMVTFQQINLLNSFDTMGKFDLILLRNVAIYFSKEVKTELFKKLAKRLNPGGYLLVGSSESLMGYSQDFEARTEAGYNFYQLK